MITRRGLLLGGALVSSLGVYSHQRGLRYPPLSFEHSANAAAVLSSEQLELDLRDCIAVEGCNTVEISNAINRHTIRAIAPEPRVFIKRLEGSAAITVLNVASNAVLEVEGPASADIDEEVRGTARIVHIKTASQGSTLKWSLPVKDGFEFAVMGDTGGGAELGWTLKRAHELGAQFLLHLGDFNYTEGEYEMAIEHFNKAKLPCYVTIGNHDFHDNGLIYQKFISQIGPMNHAFELAGTRFINVDTAVDFWPAHAGHRGALFNSLAQAGPYSGEQVIFTHRPLKDPSPHDDHEIHGIGEVDWLVEQSQKLGVGTFLNGHVHHSAEFDYQGLRQITVGEGLAYEDLVLQKPVAKMMMASVEPHKKIMHRWVDLNMPWSEHQNPTHIKKLKDDRMHKQLEWFTQLQTNSKTS